jgi:predicted RND superfamily exporter protein
MKNKLFEEYQSRFIEFILRFPKLCLSIAIFLFLVLSLGILRVDADFTPKIWFPSDSKEIKNFNLFERRFGGDQFIALGVFHENGIQDRIFIETIKELSKKLQYLPNILRVESITDFNYIKTINDDITIAPLVEDEFVIKEVIEKINDTPEVKNYIISNDFHYSLIYARHAPLFDKNPDYEELMDELEAILVPYRDLGFRFSKLGNVSVTDAFRRISWEDNFTILPIVFGCIIILLFILFKSFLAVAGPLFICLLTIGSAMGLMGPLGVTFNNVLSAVPGILLAICLADAVHILTSFYQHFSESKNVMESMRFSMHKNFLATILTTITTGVSFITISSSGLVPLSDLGMLAAFGCLFAWFNTYLVIPPLFILMPASTYKVLWGSSKSANFETSRFAPNILRFRFPIIILFALFSLTGIYLGSKNEVNADPILYFSENSQLKKDYNFTKNYLEGIRGVDIMLDSGEVDGAKNPDFLNKVQKFVDEINTDPDIFKANSILDVIKKMNQELNSGDKKYYRIPDSQNKVAELLFLYTLGLPSGGGIENQVTIDYRHLNVHIKWGIETSRDGIEKEKIIHKIARKHGLNPKTGGFFPIYTRVNDLVVKSFFQSMSLAIFLVSVIIFITFRDPLLAILAMFPNVIPLIFGALVMYFMGVYLDIGTSIVAAICLGIAVDDTIHFVTHYAQNKKKSGDVFYALNETFKTTGKALILTTILLVIGFGMFVFAQFVPNHYFGVLCAFILSFALLTDLLLLPALLVSFYDTQKTDK